jgi:hypothetical protein
MGLGGQYHVPAALPPGKTRYPLYRRLGGPQGRSGRVRKISPPKGFDPRTVQPVVSRYTDWAARPTRSNCYCQKISTYASCWETQANTRELSCIETAWIFWDAKLIRIIHVAFQKTEPEFISSNFRGMLFEYVKDIFFRNWGMLIVQGTPFMTAGHSHVVTFPTKIVGKYSLAEGR